MPTRNDLQRRGDDSADDDEEQPISADRQPGQLEAALEKGGEVDLLRLVGEEIVEGWDRHQHQADRQQHLVERARAVEPAVKQPLDDDSGERRDDEGERQRRKEGNSGAVHQQRRDIAAAHGEHAMSEVDEVHQPERHRQPAGQQEQQHAVGDAVEQDGQHLSAAPSHCFAAL